MLMSPSVIVHTEHVQKAFTEDKPFDYVFNLCGETRFGLAEDVRHRSSESLAAPANPDGYRARHVVLTFNPIHDIRYTIGVQEEELRDGRGVRQGCRQD